MIRKAINFLDTLLSRGVLFLYAIVGMGLLILLGAKFFGWLLA